MEKNENEVCGDEIAVTVGGTQERVAAELARGGKALEEILAEYSVGEEEFTKWVLDGRFSEYAEALARGLAEVSAPYIWSVLVDEAKQGKVPAIRLYFDVWAKNHSSVQRTGVSALPSAQLESLREAIFGE